MLSLGHQLHRIRSFPRTFGIILHINRAGTKPLYMRNKTRNNTVIKLHTEHKVTETHTHTHMPQMYSSYKYNDTCNICRSAHKCVLTSY